MFVTGDLLLQIYSQSNHAQCYMKSRPASYYHRSDQLFINVSGDVIWRKMFVQVVRFSVGKSCPHFSHSHLVAIISALISCIISMHEETIIILALFIMVMILEWCAAKCCGAAVGILGNSSSNVFAQLLSQPMKIRSGSCWLCAERLSNATLLHHLASYYRGGIHVCQLYLWTCDWSRLHVTAIALTIQSTLKHQSSYLWSCLACINMSVICCGNEVI